MWRRSREIDGELFIALYDWSSGEISGRWIGVFAQREFGFIPTSLITTSTLKFEISYSKKHHTYCIAISNSFCFDIGSKLSRSRSLSIITSDDASRLQDRRRDD
ncbi:hypothetical protein ACMFMG_003798 [Clarireedia jacksonii]